jgi:hypothetical protein
MDTEDWMFGDNDEVLITYLKNMKRAGRQITRSHGECYKRNENEWKKNAKISSVVELLHLSTICLTSEQLWNPKSETVYQ